MSNIKLLLRAISYKIQDRRVYGGKTGKDAFSREKVVYPFRQLIHPLDVYNDLKFEHKSSLRITFIIVALYFLISLLDQTLTAPLFQGGDPKDVNIFLVLTTTVGIVLFWCVCNWATCTLADGEGDFKTIWIMTTYSLVPVCFTTLFSIPLSYMLSQSEVIFYTTLRGIGTVWTIILLFLGMLTAHQYTVLKTIISILLTLMMMVLCFFLMMVMFSITQQIWEFGFSIFKELVV